MMRIIFALLFYALLTTTVAHAQKKKSKEKSGNSVNPDYPARDYEARASKKKRSGISYEARSEFVDRMEENWKQREKAEKNVSGKRKPDKSQPPYFGHKRPPKIRPIGKQKVCKVCHIKH
ncbi:MAG: hypothetical protein RLN86_07565 [Cyclobacteriaceae bacterium]